MRAEPIRDIEKLKKVESIFKDKRFRDYVLFKVGIHTGFRVSDILKLKVGDVQGTHINVIEQKTRKRKSAYIDSPLRDALDVYTKGVSRDRFLFQSREGENKPISTTQAYRIIREAGDKVGLKLSTHSMRKTYGYHHYQKNRDVALLMKLFNHSSESVTLEYIGINKEIEDESNKGLYDY